MTSIHFLFLDKISSERAHWLNALLHNILNIINFNYKLNELNFFLSNDALYSLIDPNVSILLKDITNKGIILHIDKSELEIYGLKIKKDRNISVDSKSDFWYNLLFKSKAKEIGNTLGFLQFDGPYMSRSSVHALRILKASLELGLTPEFYGYLDGVHIGHEGQHPSEFENIAEAFNILNENAMNQKKDFLMLACSRCGTARGYIRSTKDQDYISSEDTIDSYYFCNLNKIIDRFEEMHVILASNSGVILNYNQNLIEKRNESKKIEDKPSILIFITHSPYGTEWTFGGLSFAIACASHEIKTQVVFIEDGVYAFIGEHKILEEDKIFSIQDIIDSTSDIENLDYYIYLPSFKRRGINEYNVMDNIGFIDEKKFSKLLEISINNKNLFHKRIIFF